MRVSLPPEREREREREKEEGEKVEGEQLGSRKGRHREWDR